MDDGPLQGIRIEAEVFEGRPPSTVDLLADDSSTCRDCLAEWAQSGPSTTYTSLYRARLQLVAGRSLGVLSERPTRLAGDDRFDGSSRAPVDRRHRCAPLSCMEKR